MFELEYELQEWKKCIEQMETTHIHDAEELEQHLRDSISDLKGIGLSEYESFLIATHRVGEPDTIGREFGKVNGGHVWGQRMFWMLSGFLFFEIFQFRNTLAI